MTRNKLSAISLLMLSAVIFSSCSEKTMNRNIEVTNPQSTVAPTISPTVKPEVPITETKQETPAASPKENENVQQFKVYSNKDFGFKISYPKEWVISTEAGSGNDGAILYQKGDELITAYAEINLSEDEGNSKTTEERFKSIGYTITTISNTSGKKGLKCILQNGTTTDYLVVYENGDKLHFFRALISSDFYSKNKDLLKTISESLTF